MAFTRTSTGLQNQHLFHGVDFIVFVEGGQSYTKVQIDNGKFTEGSIDCIFWSKIFEKYKPSSKFKFKAIGSKTAVLQVADDILNNNLTTVYAAMDQEFDTVLNKIYKHDRILYTFGYSWENDVWNENVIKKIVDASSAGNIEINEVIEPFQKFIKEFKFSTYCDGYEFSNNRSFFPRPSNHLKLVDCDLSSPPFMKKDEVNNLVVIKAIVKSRVYSFGSRKKIDCHRYLYGHLLGDLAKLLLKHLLRVKHGISGLGDEIIRRMAITYFLEFIPANIDAYYREIIK
nr:DUF4435 domain-containing protein [uncultured Allomuricauda sp.]